MKFAHATQYVRVSLLCILISSSGLLGCSTASNRSLTKTERARLLVQIANGSLGEGDPTGALEILMRAEAEEPLLPEIHHSKALCFLAKKNLESALSSAKRAIELKPDYSDANNTYGKLLIDAGKYQEAMGPLMLAAQDPINRESYKAYTNLGIIAYRLGNMNESAKHMEKAIDSAPALACVAYYYRGHIDMKQSHFKDAIRDYEKATKRLCSNFSDAHLALGIAYHRNGEFDKARKKYLEIEKSYPESPIAQRAIDQLRTLP